MSAIAILLGLVAYIVAFAGTWLALDRRDRRGRRTGGALLDDLEATSVVLHTRDGKSLAGVLLAVRPDGFLIENADTLSPDGRISIGTVVVPRPNVSFFQRLPGEAA